MVNKFEVEITYFDNVAKGHDYVATLKGTEFRGFVVSSDSISGCFKELSISLAVLEDFKSKNEPLKI